MNRYYENFQIKLDRISKNGSFVLCLATQFDYRESIVDLFDKLVDLELILPNYKIDPNEITTVAKYISGRDYIVVLSESIIDGFDFFIEQWKNKETGYTFYNHPDTNLFHQSNFQNSYLEKNFFFKEVR